MDKYKHFIYLLNISLVVLFWPCFLHLQICLEEACISHYSFIFTLLSQAVNYLFVILFFFFSNIVFNAPEYFLLWVPGTNIFFCSITFIDLILYTSVSCTQSFITCLYWCHSHTIWLFDCLPISSIKNIIGNCLFRILLFSSSHPSWVH